MKYVAIIPARYASTRFPGKPLAMLGGKTVIRRVVEQVSKVLDDVYVATDDTRIYDEVVSFGGKAIMTGSYHKSGTDRIEEAYRKIGKEFDVVINVQGDEPFIHPSQIVSIMECFASNDTQIATLGKRFESMESVENANSPKIVTDNKGYAMYFSRSVIPYVRSKERNEWINAFPFLKHIGMYAYRSGVLKEITKIEQSPLEIAESLEQLRWLQNGYKIKVGITDYETVGIDTPNDLRKAEELLSNDI